MVGEGGGEEIRDRGGGRGMKVLGLNIMAHEHRLLVVDEACPHVVARYVAVVSNTSSSRAVFRSTRDG